MANAFHRNAIVCTAAADTMMSLLLLSAVSSSSAAASLEDRPTQPAAVTGETIFIWMNSRAPRSRPTGETNTATAAADNKPPPPPPLLLIEHRSDEHG